MEEREIDKILRPKKKLTTLFIIYIIIGMIFIGVVFYMKFLGREEKEALNIADVVSNGNEEDGQYVKMNIDSSPILIATNLEKDNYLYYVTDVDNNIYIVRLSNETFKNILKMHDEVTGKLKSTYELKGVTKKVDEQIKNLAISNSNKVFERNEINNNNFSQYLGKVYIEEKNGIASDRLIILYTSSVLFGLFFWILAFGYILPGILRARKVIANPELEDELRVELGSLTDIPYKKQNIYLTKNYIVSGVEAIRYDEIICGYIEEVKKYGITAGRNLIVETKDNKKHIIGSVVGKNNILVNVLEDIHNKNIEIKIDN